MSSASALKSSGFGLALGLDGPGLEYKLVHFILWDVSCQCVSQFFFQIFVKAYALYSRIFDSSPYVIYLSFLGLYHNISNDLELFL